jgi:glutathione peroxidase
MIYRIMTLALITASCWLIGCESTRTTEQAEDTRAADEPRPAIMPEPQRPAPQPAPERPTNSGGLFSHVPPSNGPMDDPDPDEPEVTLSDPIELEPVEPPVITSVGTIDIPDESADPPVITAVGTIDPVEPENTPDESAAPEDAEVPAVLNFTMMTIDGEPRDLADYQGQVLLIVNTASACGYTPHYANLQALHEHFGPQGLAVLAFPSNSFNQEQGTDEQIAEFCSTNFGVTFDLFSRISVAGPDRHPLFDVLTAADAGPVGAAPVQWNFEKFLVARDGTIVGHYPTPTDPADPALVEAIQRELARQP